MEPESAEGILRERLRGDDHAHRTLHGQLAQAHAHSGAKLLAAALEHGEVVEGDDHRTRAVEHRARHPWCVKDVGATGAMGLKDLGVRSGCFAKRTQQTAGVAPDPARISEGATVEGHLHSSPTAFIPPVA